MKRPNFLSGRVISVTQNQATIIALLAMSFFLLSSIWFGQSLVLYIVTLAVAGLMIMAYPAVGLTVIFLCTMWFERHFTLQTLFLNETNYKIYPLDFIILILAVSVIWGLMEKRIKWRPSKFDLPIIIFGLVCTVGFIHGILVGYNPALAFSTYKNYFLYGIIYVFVTLILTTRDEWQQQMRWFSIGAVGLFFFLFYGMYAGVGIWSEYTPLSTAGSRLIAGTHIFYLVLFSFWALSMLLWRSDKRQNDDPKLIATILALVSVAIIVSLVRHLWIALFAMTILWLIFLPKVERKIFSRLLIRGAMLAGFIGLILLWGYVLIVGETPREMAKAGYILKERISVSTVVSLTDTSFGWRYTSWLAGLNLWQEHPIIGAGMGPKIEGVFEIIPFSEPVRELHNNYIGVLIQLGLVGLAVVVYWFLGLIRKMLRMWKRERIFNVFERRLFFTMSSWVVLFMIVFTISVYWDLNLFVIWWWFGLAGVRWLWIQRSY